MLTSKKNAQVLTHVANAVWLSLKKKPKKILIIVSMLWLDTFRTCSNLRTMLSLFSRKRLLVRTDLSNNYLPIKKNWKRSLHKSKKF